MREFNFNGRLMQDSLDERIVELQETIDTLKQWRLVIDDITFYECKEGHGVYGIHTFDENECKMCKRMKSL